MLALALLGYCVIHVHSLDNPYPSLENSDPTQSLHIPITLILIWSLWIEMSASSPITTFLVPDWLCLYCTCPTIWWSQLFILILLLKIQPSSSPNLSSNVPSWQSHCKLLLVSNLCPASCIQVVILFGEWYFISVLWHTNTTIHAVYIHRSFMANLCTAVFTVYIVRSFVILFFVRTKFKLTSNISRFWGMLDCGCLMEKQIWWMCDDQESDTNVLSRHPNNSHYVDGMDDDNNSDQDDSQMKIRLMSTWSCGMQWCLWIWKMFVVSCMLIIPFVSLVCDPSNMFTSSTQTHCSAHI